MLNAFRLLFKNSKTDILVDARCLEWGRGGVSRIVLQVLKKWHKEEINNITLLFQISVPEDIKALFPNFNFHLIAGPKFLRRSRILSEQLLIPWILFSCKPRIYFAPWYTAPLFMGKTQLVLGLWDISYTTHPHHYRYMHRFSLGFFSRRSSKRANVIITCSDFDALQIEQFYKVPSEKIRKWYISADKRFFSKLNEINLANVRSELNLPKRFILSLGVIYNRRHVNTLISAFSDFIKFYPQISLVVVGKDATYPKKNIRKLCNDSIGNIIYLERVDDRFLPALYQLADAFYSVSTVDGETLLNKEALASSTPVITSNLLMDSIGGFASLVEEPQNAESVLKSLLNFFENFSKEKEKAIEGRNYVQKISWDIIKTDSINIFFGKQR